MIKQQGTFQLKFYELMEGLDEVEKTNLRRLSGKYREILFNKQYALYSTDSDCK